MPRALLSVSDKSGLEHFARQLEQRGWTILSTGGTARSLRAAGVRVTEVADITGHPEIMDGRVKTLHPAVHAGLLGRADHPGDAAEMNSLGYEGIDLLVVNLYPFRETIGKPGVTDGEAIEQIDIGGPSMLRSAAKNHDRVWVLCDPADYETVLGSLDGGEGARELRRTLAAKVFFHTSDYDQAIAAYLSGSSGNDDSDLPVTLELDLRRVQSLRYGENPGQQAAFYVEASTAGGSALRQLQGKELSFNNLLDVDGAVLSVSAWESDGIVACSIIKHTTPCGLAVGADAAEAYARALSTDPVSAFGSVVAFSAEVSGAAAELIRGNFVEAVVAPGFSPEALACLSEKKNLRLLLKGGAGPRQEELDIKKVQDGFLIQQRMRVRTVESEWQTVTDRGPTPGELDDLRFAWRAVAAVKSNAILIARDGRTLGIGAGQMSRVDASRIAVMKAADNGHDLTGAALASDAFFPFRDGVDAAASAGVRAIIQPGGSKKDPEVISAANEHGIAMIFTGQRLFRH